MITNERINGNLKVTVLTGGIGAEREVSLQSGSCVAEALKKADVEVVVVDIRPDDLETLEDESVDVYFIALHGKFGEDGQLQQILEDRSLCYTASGPAASAMAFDKMASKESFIKAGINTPAAIEFNCDTDMRSLESKLQQLAGKYVIKPIRQGSSVGISIVTEVDEAVAAANKCLSEFGDCMIEEFIDGREITVGILDGKALPIIEIRSKIGFYDYQAKYVDEQTEYLFDTITDAALAARIKAAATECFNVLGCRHFARVDFILADDSVAYGLEANTIPGFTTHSLLPKAAEKAGLSMSDLCVRIVETALDGRESKTIR